MESESGHAVWLVDCGDFDKVHTEIGNSVIEGVLLTHAHFDHIYGLTELFNLFPQCKVVTNESGREALENPRLNLSRYHGTPMRIPKERIITVHDGDSVPLFDGILAYVHETPGHNPSCLTFEVGEYLFTGDAYIPGEKIVTNLPGGNKALAAASVTRILDLSRGKTICPGHGTI